MSRTRTNAAGIYVSATDRLLGRVSASAGAAEEIAISDFVQSLLNDSDAATARATLVAAALSEAQTFTGGQRGTITALSSSSNTMTPNLNTNNLFSHTFTENTTLANPSNIASAVGQGGAIFLTQHASAPKTLSFGSYWMFEGGTAPTITATNDAADLILYLVRSSTHIDALALLDMQ